MTKVRISNPFLLNGLREELEARSDCVVVPLARDVVELTIVGSYRTEVMRLEVALRVRAWEAAQRARGIDVQVDLI